MANALEPTTIVTSAARTTDSNSGGQSISQYSKLTILINVTAVTGTGPSAAFTIEWSHDGTTWAQSDAADSFTAITAASAKVKLFDAKAPHYRLAWALTGTSPSFTFTASQYALEA